MLGSTKITRPPLPRREVEGGESSCWNWLFHTFLVAEASLLCEPPSEVFQDGSEDGSEDGLGDGLLVM